MIEFMKGDIFTSGCQFLVNPVPVMVDKVRKVIRVQAWE